MDTYCWRGDELGRCLWWGSAGSSRSTNERWVVGVDVRGLNVDQTLSIFRGWTQAFPQKIRDSLDKLSMKSRESLKLL